MALEPESPVAATRMEYTCPMHPEIVRAGAGQLPDLRHGAGAAHRHRGGRRQSRTARHDAPLLDQPGADRSAARDRHGHMLPGMPYRAADAGRLAAWVELALATPVVLWGGWPFFQRGWTSIVNRSTNMFTLIGMGTGVAYVYSVVATVVSANFPGIVPRDGRQAAGVFRSGGSDHHAGAAGAGAGTARAQPDRRGIRALLDLTPKMARVSARRTRSTIFRWSRCSRETGCGCVREKKFRWTACARRQRARWTNR